MATSRTRMRREQPQIDVEEPELFSKEMRAAFKSLR